MAPNAITTTQKIMLKKAISYRTQKMSITAVSLKNVREDL
jgi:hypothetical protein